MDESNVPWMFTGVLALASLALLTFVIYQRKKLTSLGYVASLPGPIEFLFQTGVHLIPNFVFLAGPIIDLITQRYEYTKASITGLIGILFVSIIGSKRFGSVSSSILGWFAPSAGTPGEDGKVSTLSTIAGVMPTIVGVILLLGGIGAGVFGIMKGSGTISIASSSTLGVISIVFIFAILSNLGFLRNESLPPVPITSVLGKISAYMTGSPIVATAATGGGVVEIAGEKCVLPGYDGLEVQLAPSHITLTSTILFCHLVEFWFTNKPMETISGGIAAALIFGVQLASFYLSDNNCPKYYRWGKFAPFISLILGFTFASSAYGVIKATGRENFEAEPGVFHPNITKPDSKEPPAIGKPNIKVKTSGESTKASADLFEKAENEDYEEVVGVLFKDGEPITDISILKS
jgi:hypothetical protein